MVNAVMFAERHLFISAIDRGGTGIDKVLDIIMAASLKDVCEPLEIGVDIGMRIFE